MENFLQNRKSCNKLSPESSHSSEPDPSVDSFGEITNNRQQLPSVELEVPDNNNGLTPPKVSYQISDQRVEKIIVTCPDGQVLTINCEY